MVGRFPTLLALAAILALSFAGCTARGDAVTVEAPDWRPGYTWAFDGTYAYSWEEEFDGERDSGNESGTYHVEQVVANTTFKADGEPVYLTVERIRSEDDDLPVEVGRPYLAAYRQRDLKELEVDGSRSETCNTSGGCTATLQEIEFDDDESGIDHLPFPLRTGQTWSGEYELYDDIHMRYTAEAGRMIAVKTPLGPIDAMRIEIRHAPIDFGELREEIEEEATEDGGRIEGLDLDIRFQEVLYYSPAYQTIVRYAATGGERFSATFVDEDGERQSARFESRFEERNTLAGARLVAGPERTQEEIGLMLSTGEGLDDVAGVPVPESAYTLAIHVADGTVNTFENEAGRFEAVLQGADVLPEGHSLRWTLQNRNGMTTESGEGAVFEPAPEQPGRYGVLLDAVDAEGAVLASSGSSLVADYVGTASISCGIVTARPLVQVGACESLAVPVHPGAVALLLVATADQNNPLAGLRVLDSLGQDVPVERRGQDHVVEMDSFAGYNLGNEPWTAVWDATVGVLEGADVTMSILYGTGPIQATMQVDTGTPGRFHTGTDLPSMHDWIGRAT